MDIAKKFQGIFPAIVTPFKADSGIDMEALEKLVGRLFETGVNGLFVGGNMGEWYSQTIEERKQVAALSLKLSQGKRDVLLHVGSTRTEDTIELARYAEDAGIAAVASLPPYHARLTEKDVIAYYHNLCKATKLPVFMYYHPALTGYQLTAGVFDMIRTLPNMAGVKYTDYDLLNLTNLIEARDNGLSIMNGHDQILFPSLVMGASGGIGSFYNIIPKAFTSLYKYSAEGKMAEAKALQLQINAFIQVMKKYPLILVLKYILQLGKITTENFRVAMMPLSLDEKSQIQRDLDGSQFFSQWKV